tara:strand:+ start:1948 stop:2805 length:858 start_codon:yes stop_codon:yes gene_type:complete
MDAEDTENINEMAKENMKGDPPNILAVSAIFIGITVAYLIAKYMMQAEGSILGLCYIAAVLAFQYFFNMWAMLSIHKDTSVSSGLMSLSFWITFIIIYLIINIGIPAWKQPFSNTIGYSIASLVINANYIFKQSLVRGGNMPMVSDNPEEIPKSGVQQFMTNDIRDSIRFMNSDPAIVLTKSRPSTFPTFWNNLGKAGLLKKGWDNKTNDMGNHYNALLSWFYLKDIVSEGTWLILCGMITILITYNYIHGQHMVPSIKSIEQQTIPNTDPPSKQINPMLYRTNR